MEQLLDNLIPLIFVIVIGLGALLRKVHEVQEEARQRSLREQRRHEAGAGRNRQPAGRQAKTISKAHRDISETIRTAEPRHRPETKAPIRTARARQPGPHPAEPVSEPRPRPAIPVEGEASPPYTPGKGQPTRLSTEEPAAYERRVQAPAPERSIVRPAAPTQQRQRRPAAAAAPSAPKPQRVKARPTRTLAYRPQQYRTERRKARKGRPVFLLRNLEDARQGIVLSEILGPPKAFRP